MLKALGSTARPATKREASELIDKLKNGLGTGLTLTAYAGSVIVAQTTARGTLKDTLDARDSLNQQLFTRFSSESGVNVDRELALMIEIQSSYAASAKVIQATRQMFDDLMSIAQ